MPIETSEPFSDGWWLHRLYKQLRVQQKHCDDLQKRYEGDSPLPFVADLQRDAVRWFVEKARANFERLIVNAVLSRLRINGIRTAVDSDEGGDSDAFTLWTKARMKLVTLDVHKMTLGMSMAYAIVGKDRETRDLLVTAEDPRQVTAICDPANPYRVLAALKLFHDDVFDQDVAYLYLPGRNRVARKPRVTRGPTSGVVFSPATWDWDDDVFDDDGNLVRLSDSGVVAELQADEAAGLPAMACVVPFVNEDGMAEFEPFLNNIDRINQQILQRMTIATVQAFKQRAFKGLPLTDPKTGEEIDWNDIFVADPGAVWNIPASVEIWESGQVDLSPILMSIRDDVKDLAATSGTPLYTISPDAANGSAEGASLQREQVTFKVGARQDRFDPSHQLLAELMFRMAGDPQRGAPRSVEILWAPANQTSMTERANAIAQTKGVIPRYQQLTEIWGMDPAQADRAASELTSDMVLDQQFALAAAQAASQATQPSTQQQVAPGANGGS